jgi:hypothetical protein
VRFWYLPEVPLTQEQTPRISGDPFTTCSYYRMAKTKQQKKNKQKGGTNQKGAKRSSPTMVYTTSIAIPPNGVAQPVPVTPQLFGLPAACRVSSAKVTLTVSGTAGHAVLFAQARAIGNTPSDICVVGGTKTLKLDLSAQPAGHVYAGGDTIATILFPRGSNAGCNVFCRFLATVSMVA